jgi:hypothetical protein
MMVNAMKNKIRIGNDGYALMASAVFAMVAIMMGFSFFAVTAAESRSARYREESTEAFFLADGAIERARAKLLEDRTWRDGWQAEAAGNGTYSLVLRDTTIGEEANLVKLLATGQVASVQRKVEALVKIPPTALALALFVGDDAEIDGEICLQGQAHISDEVDFRPNNGEISCGGSFTAEFALTPPSVRTDPEAYPNTTYYYVLGDLDNRKYIGRIFDRYGYELTDRAGDQMRDVVSYKKNQDLFTYDFDRESILEKYFDDEDGVFRRDPGDVAVVVNFGEPSLLPSSQTDRARIILEGDENSVIHATIINNRFLGVSDSQRLDPDMWYGGKTQLREIIMEPFLGIALIAATLVNDQPDEVRLGSDLRPALVYATERVQKIRDDFQMTGTMVTLGDFFCDGDVQFTYSEVLQDILPSYLTLEWNSGVSGTLEMVRWTEGDPSGQ